MRTGTLKRSENDSAVISARSHSMAYLATHAPSCPAFGRDWSTSAVPDRTTMSPPSHRNPTGGGSAGRSHGRQPHDGLFAQAPRNARAELAALVDHEAIVTRTAPSPTRWTVRPLRLGAPTGVRPPH